MAVKVHAVKLNESAFEYAKKLITEGKAVLDQRDDWSEHQPSTQEENRFIEENGFAEYARWHLGVDEERPADTKARYKFPYGDFRNVHRCAVLTAEPRAGQSNHTPLDLPSPPFHAIFDPPIYSPPPPTP